MSPHHIPGIMSIVTSRWKLLWCVVLCAWLVNACGFQLRGMMAFPESLQPLFVAGLDVHDPVRYELVTLLQANGIELADTPAQAQAHLRILAIDDTRRVLSVGIDARVSEYEITTTLRYTLLDNHAQVLIPRSQVNVRRDYAHDPKGVLGQTEQETLLREDMRRDVLRLLLYRLQTHTMDKKPDVLPIHPNLEE